MKQFDFIRGANLIFSSIALIMIFLTSMALFFEWKWGIVFMSVIGITVGSYLIIESKIKNITALVKKQSFKFRHILHSFSFAFGLTGIILSVILLILNRVPELVGLIAWFYIMLGLLTISEAIENFV